MVETDANKVKAALSAANIDKLDSANSKAASEARRGRLAAALWARLTEKHRAGKKKELEQGSAIGKWQRKRLRGFSGDGTQTFPL